MLRFLSTPDASDLTQQSILRYCRQLDPKASRADAKLYLNNKDLGVRLEAALILFQTGERSASLSILGDALAGGDEYSVLNLSSMIEAVELLLKDGSAASLKAAGRLFSNQKLKTWSNEHARSSILRSFSAAGYSDGYTFYRGLLEVKGNVLEQTTYGAPVAENFANEVTERFAPEDPAIIEIKKKYPNVPDQIAPLKKWLTEKEKSAKVSVKK